MSATRPVKAKKGKIESDVEKMRAEGAWNKAVELISLHKNDSALSRLTLDVSTSRLPLLLGDGGKQARAL